MAKRKHLKILKRGVSEWNRWRTENPLVKPDLSRANLSGKHLRAVNLSNTDLEETDLSGADLGNAVLNKSLLSFVDLRHSNLQGADLRKVSMIHAAFERSDLRNANPKKAKLHNSGFERADLRLTNLGEADIFSVDFTQANLSGLNLSFCDLSQLNLDGAILERANLTGTDLRGANLRGANLRFAVLDQAKLGSSGFVRGKWGLPEKAIPRGSGILASETVVTNTDVRGARFINADLTGVNFAQANLSELNLSGSTLAAADLRHADMSGANLSGADLSDADLSFAIFRAADLSGANLQMALLVQSDLSEAKLDDCEVYGTSIWSPILENTSQSNIVITQRKEPKITTDNIELAQFLYLLTQNSKLREIVDTISSKVVLILGRFTSERKLVLDAIREELRKRNYLPVVFDFQKPAHRNFTETVSLLARLSRFVIADITDAKSIPQELMAIVPNIPSVPVQPLLLSGASEYGMFEDFSAYPWVMKTYLYDSVDSLIENLSEKVIAPVETNLR